MGRGLVVAGAILTILAILGIIAVLAINLVPISSTHVPAGDVASLSTSGLNGNLGPIWATVSWTGAGAGATVYLTSTNPASYVGACSSPQGLVAQGSGDSGSIKATLSSGPTYYLYTCAAGSPVAFSYNTSTIGISYVLLIAIIVLIIGILLWRAGRRRNRVAAAAKLPAT